MRRARHQHRGAAESSVQAATDTVGPRWVVWPAVAIALLAWVLGRLTHVAYFRLVVVAALAWLGGWSLSAFVGRALVRSGQLSPVHGVDQPEVDEQQ
jgi:hypothetical protein